MTTTTEEAKRHLFTNGTDTYAAETVEEAVRLRDKDAGFTPGEQFYPDDEFEPVPENHVLKVRWEDDPPEWVEKEDGAWFARDLEFDIPLVCAPAHIWAKHEGPGMVCSTEY